MADRAARRERTTERERPAMAAQGGGSDAGASATFSRRGGWPSGRSSDRSRRTRARRARRPDRAPTGTVRPGPSRGSAARRARARAALPGSARERRRVFLQDRRQRVGRAAAIERAPAGDELVDDAAKARRCRRGDRPAARAPVRAPCSRPCPSRDPAPCWRSSRRSVARQPGAGQTEVENLDVAVVRYDHVCRA